MSLNIGCSALLLGAALLLAVPAISTAQDFASIDAKNRDSIVFVHSKKFRKDGAGVARDSYGTGFIISPLGYVLTAGHVLLDEDNDSIVETRVAVRTRRGQMYRVEPVKKDSELDLALLLLPDAGIAWRSVSWGQDVIKKDRRGKFRLK
jgi:S1-C subfamily serine protease